MLLSIAIGYFLAALVVRRFNPSSGASRWLAILAAVFVVLSFMLVPPSADDQGFDSQIDCAAAARGACQVAWDFNVGGGQAF
jgi:hypothetical protein